MKPEWSPSPWFILIIVLLASMAASLNQFKVPPIMPLLLTTFQASSTQGGLLMSAFALAGLFLAIPAGFLLEKFGYRLTGVLAMSSLIFGGAFGAVTEKIDILLVGRFFEGAGMSLFAVAAPALVALYFSREKRGQAMGVWGVWVPLGSLIMFLIAPPLAGHGGYRAVWWFGIFYTAVTGILFGLFIRSRPRPPARTQSPPFGTDVSPPGSAMLRNGQLWLASLLFGCFNFVYTAFITWTPTFLNQVRGVPIARADLLVSTTNVLVIVASPLAGWLSDRIGSRKAVCSVPLLLLTFLFPLNAERDCKFFSSIGDGHRFLCRVRPAGHLFGRSGNCGG